MLGTVMAVQFTVRSLNWMLEEVIIPWKNNKLSEVGAAPLRRRACGELDLTEEEWDQLDECGGWHLIEQGMRNKQFHQGVVDIENRKRELVNRFKRRSKK